MTMIIALILCQLAFCCKILSLGHNSGQFFIKVKCHSSTIYSKAPSDVFFFHSFCTQLHFIKMLARAPCRLCIGVQLEWEHGREDWRENDERLKWKKEEDNGRGKDRRAPLHTHLLHFL